VRVCHPQFANHYKKESSQHAATSQTTANS
jgi:hypothetical protein